MYHIIIIGILILLIYPHWMFRGFNDTLQSYTYDETQFNTGDILFFKKDEPAIYRKNGKILVQPFLFENLYQSIMYYIQGVYTHCGVVVVHNDIPYIVQISGDILYDGYKQKYNIDGPCLSKLDDIFSYQGVVYHHRYLGSPQTVDTDFIDNIYGENYKINRDVLSIIPSNILKLSQHGNDLMCVDLANIILYKLGIVDNYKTDNNLSDIRKLVKDNNYTQTPVILETLWYQSVYKP